MDNLLDILYEIYLNVPRLNLINLSVELGFNQIIEVESKSENMRYIHLNSSNVVVQGKIQAIHLM